MIEAELTGWKQVHAEVLRRIHSREWKPGEFIPNENVLARELGFARATVNRALRNLADSGLLERRRKLGTRVALLPEREARVSIANMRKEIERKGFRYNHGILLKETAVMPERIRIALGLPCSTVGVHVKIQRAASISSSPRQASLSPGAASAASSASSRPA